MPTQYDPHAYKWYGGADSKPLEQGDLLRKIPLIALAKAFGEDELAAGERPAVSVSIEDVIVLSQSCDINNKKIDTVIICPHYAVKDISPVPDKSQIKRIQTGTVFGLHMLPQITEREDIGERRVVYFRSSVSIPFDIVSRYAEIQTERMRLLPPYREHMSHAFAAFFGRVALPIDYPMT